MPGAQRRAAQQEVAETQRILARANFCAEKSHTAWLTEMTRNARAVTHADVDRRDNLAATAKEEALSSVRADRLRLRAEEAQKERQIALTAYLSSVTGRPASESTAAEQRDNYLARAKKLRQKKEEKERIRRMEHDTGRNPYSPALARTKVVKRSKTKLYFPIPSTGVRDFRRVGISFTEAKDRFREMTSAYALSYNSARKEAVIYTLNRDGVRGTYSFVADNQWTTFMRGVAEWKMA